MKFTMFVLSTKYCRLPYGARSFHLQKLRKIKTISNKIYDVYFECKILQATVRHKKFLFAKTAEKNLALIKIFIV